jgi:hypothetical protein
VVEGRRRGMGGRGGMGDVEELGDMEQMGGNGRWHEVKMISTYVVA